MKKKNWILTGLVTFLLASSFLFIGFSSHASAQKNKSTCCCQKMSVSSGGKNCAARTKSSASGEMILENLSTQFLFISPLGY
jgi:hypothetical protein